ncbi:MAM and LDL-receptor class A domain-containing protein 1-like [Pomacea canaliculata]|uniref:MAM and LDL-receptor class A domain-containing protein 1-like n=1 Tax=Pomacea canaliculata TaxID=400727 RepID=UPI000D73797E|nr:MAM and LDL-receptor class A domain-containing protein 1-like [Pomacea canaliculata]
MLGLLMGRSGQVLVSRAPTGWKPHPSFSIDTPFQIIIEAYMAMANQVIAIDDVSFTPDCQHSVSNLPSLPVSTTAKPTVPPTTKICSIIELKCDNGQQCYAKTRLCDNKKDCADGSDEASSKCSCNSRLCRNGGQCSVKAGIGPTCNCTNNYSGLYCNNPPATSGRHGGSSTKNWAIPVGVSLGLAAVGAITGSVIFFWRRNRRLPFLRQHRTDDTQYLTNVVYDSTENTDNTPGTGL